MNRRPMAAIAEEDAEPVATAEEDADEDDGDETDVPEIEVDEDAEVDSAIVRD